METTVTIKALPLSGVVRVFDKTTRSVVFSGTEDVIPEKILLQVPEKIYSVDDVTYIDIVAQRVFYDVEAAWYYYESFFRSLYEELDPEDRASTTFDQFMIDTLKSEPVWEVF